MTENNGNGSATTVLVTVIIIVIIGVAFYFGFVRGYLNNEGDGGVKIELNTPGNGGREY